MINLLSKAFAKIFGTKSERDLKEIMPLVAQTNEAWRALASLSDDALREKTSQIKAQIAQHLRAIDDQLADLHKQIADQPDLSIHEKETIFEQIDKLELERNKSLEVVLMEVLPDAFAVVKETARRLKENKQLVVTATPHDEWIAARRGAVRIENGKATWPNQWMAAGNQIEWDMMHYDVQLIGGIVLHQGKISEMATGEGKTLVATLPAFLNALAGRGVHIVTVNDYLARRDSEWMAPLFEFHGLKVDCIDTHEPHSPGRKNAYLADITYGTNNEFGFDYLRDNMARTPEELVQRRHHYAMVDEVDSVLVDDARTPLIISGPVPRGDEHEFYDLKPRVFKVVEAQKKLINQFLTDARKFIAEGKEEEGGLCLFRAYRGYPKYKPLIKFLSEPGIKQLLQKTENIYLAENSRLMPQADKPLYFVIEEKLNSVDLTENGLELITKEGEDREFFVLPDLGSKIAELEKRGLPPQELLVEKEKLVSDYSAKTRRIHTTTQLLKAYTMFEKDVDYIIVDGKVKIVDEQTGRVLEGRRYSDGLHQALEAKESVKVEDATQTYATVTLQNYFRMYHKLAGMTGTAETEAGEFWEIYKLDVVCIPTNRSIQRDDRDDKVYRTVREKFNAVVEEIQLLVKQGRPVLVGTTSVESSELLSRMLQIRRIPHQVLNAKQHAREAEVVALAGQPGTVTIATNMAGRGTDIKLHPDSKAAGGLAIIGTERHESRRVDRQLRGRSGRQGDPGSSQFFVSLEDNLMRLFGSDRIASVMDRIGLQEGEVIQHSMITRSIERAQRKVEENNFGIRKRLLEYDNVMNAQREVIYRRRRNALFGERLQLDIMNAFYEVAATLVENNRSNYENFQLEVMRVFGLLETSITAEDLSKKANGEALAERLYQEAYKLYSDKNKALAERAFPVIAHVKEERGATVQDLIVPLTDGVKFLQMPVSLEAAFQSKGHAIISEMEKNIVLAIIDQGWKEHLRDMDDLKQEVQNAVHEQKDPLLIYKFEAFELFKSFLDGVNEEMIMFLSKASIPVQDPSQVQGSAGPVQQPRRPKVQTNKAESGPITGNTPLPEEAPAEKYATAPISSQKIKGRNDRVSVRYPDGTVKKDVKFKSVEEDVRQNRCVLIEE